ncbi:MULTISPECIES: hypothetical protein [Pseudomonas]|uniref:hypothetical protein n=1 Tax=Pseudomonas TaxID=286 RepID=UPI001238B7AD|nr:MULTISPECIES: hypothetical protein [Pseudomonas]MBA1247223.1 hypothetical protein [Pseudomonas zeshuii]QEU28157.1 hypothetical protein FOB45_10275 [Pseudomonas luteola]
MPSRILKVTLLIGCLISAGEAAAFERERVYGPPPHHENYKAPITYRQLQRLHYHRLHARHYYAPPPRHRAHYQSLRRRITGPLSNGD